MADYKKMYHIIFNAAADAERLLDEDTKASMILRNARQECEELYIESEIGPIAMRTHDREAAGE